MKRRILKGDKLACIKTLLTECETDHQFTNGHVYIVKHVSNAGVLLKDDTGELYTLTPSELLTHFGVSREL